MALDRACLLYGRSSGCDRTAISLGFVIILHAPQSSTVTDTTVSITFDTVFKPPAAGSRSAHHNQSTKSRFAASMSVAPKQAPRCTALPHTLTARLLSMSSMLPPWRSFCLLHQCRSEMLQRPSSLQIESSMAIVIHIHSETLVLRGVGPIWRLIGCHSSAL